MVEEEAQLLTVKEVAKILNMSKLQVYRMIYAKKIPFIICPPHTYRIPREPLMRWIAGGVVEPRDDPR